MPHTTVKGRHYSDELYTFSNLALVNTGESTEVYPGGRIMSDLVINQYKFKIVDKRTGELSAILDGWVSSTEPEIFHVAMVRKPFTRALGTLKDPHVGKTSPRDIIDILRQLKRQLPGNITRVIGERISGAKEISLRAGRAVDLMQRINISRLSESHFISLKVKSQSPTTFLVTDEEQAITEVAQVSVGVDNVLRVSGIQPALLEVVKDQIIKFFPHARGIEPGPDFSEQDVHKFAFGIRARINSLELEGKVWRQLFRKTSKVRDDEDEWDGAEEEMVEELGFDPRDLSPTNLNLIEDAALLESEKQFRKINELITLGPPELRDERFSIQADAIHKFAVGMGERFHRLRGEGRDWRALFRRVVSVREGNLEWREVHEDMIDELGLDPDDLSDTNLDRIEQAAIVESEKWFRLSRELMALGPPELR